MIGDNIQLEESQLVQCQKVLKRIQDHTDQMPFCISVAGESGSGKSTLAIGLQQVLQAQLGSKVIVIHMDDYFALPPADNHNARVADLDHLGPSEVRLDLIDAHVQAIKSKVSNLKKPLVDFHQNKILEETIDTVDVDCVIVEGTYVSILQQADYKIFIDRTYKDTLEDRIKRAREPITPFIENVLDIEHQIISGHKQYADCVIDKDFEIV